MKNSKILILGYGRHGKDSAAELLVNYFKLNFYSASLLAAELFIFDKLKDIYHYNNVKECYDDRSNHRAEWHELINNFNAENPNNDLTKQLMEKSDIYVGMRSVTDFVKYQIYFDLIIWVDASKRLPKENEDSCELTPDCADIIIDNNSDFEWFAHKVNRLGKLIYTLTVSKNLSPLSFEEWYDLNEEKINIELAENGADRELDFNSEKEFQKRYEKYIDNSK